MSNIKKYLGVAIILIVVIVVIALMTRDNNTDQFITGDTSDTSSSTINNNLASTTVDINKNNNTNMNNNEQKSYTQATLHTSLGDITFELAKDKPLTTENFTKLASTGFYNGVKFHRVINGFMIQTGDPLSKDDSQKMYWGTGGPGYKFADELTGKETYSMGTVAMANSGPNTNGSQFFIMTSNTPLPPSYTVFGKVIAGQDVAQKIQDVATDANDRPINPIIINSIDLK